MVIWRWFETPLSIKTLTEHFIYETYEGKKKMIFLVLQYQTNDVYNILFIYLFSGILFKINMYIYYIWKKTYTNTGNKKNQK